ncbi:MAG: PD-(D/E)XK nuclease family protein [Bacteroidia bacterium]|nr:PD-(D/E)XK nuclease family protein [Bacteroidia bacterium]NND52669.1 PD-(D/E)XK nuclease family protein [Flavobacteriaceae bacterium]
MTSFISDVLNHLQQRGVDFSELTIILPSKRAGNFLRNELSKMVSKSLFSPEILSTEDFVEELSQLNPLSGIELLFEFYEIYQTHSSPETKESFDDFLKWASILLQDFNEIDRYLIDPPAIFNYLSAIKDMNHWSLSPEKTPLMKEYLAFWKSLHLYYSELSAGLISKGLGYQGLLFREAVENLENYIQSNPGKQHIFIGFNALNEAESRIIQELLHNEMAEIFWDTDDHFITNKKHEASYFIRHYLKSWRYLKSSKLKWSFNHYTTEKNINIIGTPKSVGQAKYIGEILSELDLKERNQENTALILGDENLLMPVLNSIPKTIDKINVTMGFPLKSIPLASLFERLFLIHKDGKTSFYYKDVVELLSHQYIMPLFYTKEGNSAEKVIKDIQLNNMIFLTEETIANLCQDNQTLVHLLFGAWNKDPMEGLRSCQNIILKIKEQLDLTREANKLGLEYLFKFNEVFNVLVALNKKYSSINSIAVLFSLYKQILSQETLDFQGEPLEGLQIMGMLESRVLDFETVIISSVNEGILPSGKTQNSFIPFDVKLENNLPTYKEKDAIYAYHFYRVLHRAKNIYILYDTETDGLNAGEKSRFITQLEIEDVHKLKSMIVSPRVPKYQLEPKVITKTDSVLNSIRLWAQKGISPSALMTYIRNPIDFYSEKILGIKEFDDVEEVVGARTLGTIIHETLRELYAPFVNQFLKVETIKSLIPKINEVVEKQFKIQYRKGELNKGKNLIIFEIAKRYVNKFLDMEINAILKGDVIKLLAVEQNVETLLEFKELPFPLKLTGEIDRIDECNGVTRIIDYKSGHVFQNQVEIINWEDLTSDYKKYSKSFQILMYAFILNKEKAFQDPVQAGIISFKNLSAGLLKYSQKDKMGPGAKKDPLITKESFQSFETELKKLILEIFDPKIDFIEKEV